MAAACPAHTNTHTHTLIPRHRAQARKTGTTAGAPRSTTGEVHVGCSPGLMAAPCPGWKDAGCPAHTVTHGLAFSLSRGELTFTTACPATSWGQEPAATSVGSRVPTTQRNCGQCYVLLAMLLLLITDSPGLPRPDAIARTPTATIAAPHPWAQPGTLTTARTCPGAAPPRHCTRPWL